ncbi:uncharacterized protein TNCV_1069311 [Trichonephila clavipes]|nr:uncharacterized protein TNCV_1069311 [Trichonephila clavipes]
MSISEILMRRLRLRDFISFSILVSLSLKSPRLVILSRFLFFDNKSLTALKPHSAKYEDGKGNNSFLTDLIEYGYLVSVLSQSHAIAPYILNKVLTDSSFCISESSWYCIEISNTSTRIGCFTHVGK